ncbi:hypothetical protein ZHX_gp21 [Edwardsiella phage vB_EpP_ZHX]|nr:hypothetical protein ZHX_gp21 [Edwardsiella phage vB_EpP_ZHX]
MTKHELVAYVMGVAAKSNIEKRRIGCVIVDSKGRVLGEGYNTSEVHAEIAALKSMLNRVSNADPVKANETRTVYVTHQPCPACARQLAVVLGTDTKIEVVEAFLKFDGDKLRMDLIPPSATKALAEVLTFGARKYKPNNWKNVEEADRYVAALMRHVEAYREGELIDPESGLHHLAHAMTNIAFLIELDHKPQTWLRNGSKA